MSEIRTNILISGESSEYRSNIEISIVTLNSALVDTHSSFRTNLDITTTLKDGSISAIKTNLELNNVALKFNLVDMTKLKQSLLYFSKFFNMYFEPEVMWDLLAQGTNEQINISHLNEALSNYVKVDATNNILTDLEKVKLNLQEHIEDNKKHFTDKEKEFLLNLMENPNGFGSGDSLFEKVSINQNNIILPAVKPLKQDGKDAGIISDTFISCRGVDSTASSGGGGITRIDLFNILSDEPISDSEFINNKFLKISPLIEDWIKSNLKAFETDPTVSDFIKKITEEQIKSWDAVASWFDISEDESYILTTNGRGFVSHSFISCKGLDVSAASSGGSFSRSELFDILSDNPQEGERINLKYLIGLEELVESLGFLKDINKNKVITALGYIPLQENDFKDFATISNIVKQDVDNWNFVFSLIGLSKDELYIFPKENRGFVSNSFISCRGLDVTAPQASGTFNRSSLFEILSNKPQDGEFIDLRFLNLNDYVTIDYITSQGYITSNALSEYATQQWVLNKNYASQDDLTTLISGMNSAISTNSSNITAVSNRVQKFEDVIGIDANGDVYIKGTRNFYTEGGTIGMAGLGSGGSGGGGTAGLGSVTVRVNGQDYITDASGIVTIPNYPTSLPASDVYAWAKAATKPSYTASEVGALSTSGGTISGNLIIQNKTVDVITLYRDDVNNSPSIKFTNKSDGTLGYIGVLGSGSDIGIQPFFMDSAGTVNKVWHSGNFNPSNYLPLSGGTISSGSVGLYIQRDANPKIGFNYNSTTLGFIGFNTNSEPIVQIGVGAEKPLIHSGNIGSQSVNYASSAGNADTLDGYHAVTSGPLGYTIPVIGGDGVMEIGAYLDMHHDNSTVNYDFSVRLSCPAVSGVNVILPSASGTLALLTSNVASAIKLQDSNGVLIHNNGSTFYIGDTIYPNVPTHILGKEIVLRYSANATYGLTLKENGNVLIGTTSDNGAKLQVNGGVTTYGNINMQSVGEIQNAKSISIYDSGLGYYVGSRNAGLGVTDGGALIYTYGSTPISLYTNGSERLRIDGGGDVIIYKNLWSEGTMAMAKLASSSDRKLKDNIAEVPTEQSMSIIRQLRPTTWNWKKDGKKSYGFIAQEVAPIVPEMVVDMGHLHLEYNQLHAFEIGAIKHLDIKVETQEHKIERLENRVTELENELKQYRRNAQWQ